MRVYFQAQGRQSAQGRWLAVLLLTALLCGLGTLPLHAQTDGAQSDAAPIISTGELLRQVKAFVGQQVADDQFSGTILIAKDGEVLYQHAFGLASIAYGVPNRVDTKFNLGSMNKMFTAVAIAQLAEAGKLAFDDPIRKHLPDYANQAVAEQVTIHHLLTHTSGLVDYFNDEFTAASRARFRTIADFFPLFVAEPLQFEPGSQWAYSNSNFIVLGAIVEAVSGEDYFDYVREHIYEPAGMINTDAYELDHETPNLATGYMLPPGATERQNNLFEHVIKGGPAGGGYSTVEDLLHFAQALTGHELLSAASTELVTAPKVAAPGPYDAHYSYGFTHETLNGYQRIGHSGGFPGINSELHIYPELGYVVAVMANYDPPSANLIAVRIAKLLTGIEIPQAIKLPAATLLPYTNRYTLVGEAMGPETIAIEADEGALWLVIGGNRHRFLPLSATEFYDEQAEEIRMVFTLDDQGAPVSLTLANAGPEVLEYTVTPAAE